MAYSPKRQSDNSPLRRVDDEESLGTRSSRSSSFSTTSSSSSSSSSSEGEPDEVKNYTTPPHRPRAPSSSAADAKRCGGMPSTASLEDKVNKKKPSKRSRFLPQFLAEHGRTVYGGNPIVQQTLPGWFAYPPVSIVIPVFFVFMIPCIVMGACMVAESSRRYMVVVPYSQVHKYQYTPSDPAVNINQGIRTFMFNGVPQPQGTVTWVEFNITKEMKAPVYMYYKIDGFYQNTKDFYSGRSITQMKGDGKVVGGYACKPYEKVGYINKEGDHMTVTYTNPQGRVVKRTVSDFTYNPCGLAPWSMFNDSLRLYKVAKDAADANLNGGDDGTVPLSLVCNGSDFDVFGVPLKRSVGNNLCAKRGISWRADNNVRFKNLTIKDDWWSLYYPHVTDNEFLNNGWYLNEAGHALPDPVDLDLQVWVKSAVLSHFRKLYRVISTDLQPGSYMLQVDEFFDVVSFRGTKSLVLRTTSWIGDANVAMGIVFIVMGCVACVLGLSFTIEYCLRRMGCDRVAHLPEPKRSWYYFDPSAPEMKAYYELRMQRHIPVAELQVLRALHEQDKHTTCGNSL